MKKYEGMSDLELATLIADRWVKTHPNATQGHRWKCVKEEALEVIKHVRDQAYQEGFKRGAAPITGGTL